MDADTRQAYEWALNQAYPSVAARYSKTLAVFIKNTSADEERIRREAIEESLDSFVEYLGQTAVPDTVRRNCSVLAREFKSLTLRALSDPRPDAKEG